MVRRYFERDMIKAGKTHLRRVSVEAEVTIGETWAEKK